MNNHFATAKRREALAVVENERSTPQAKIEAIDDFERNIRYQATPTRDRLKEQFQTSLSTFLSDPDGDVRSRAAWYLYEAGVSDPRMVDIFVADFGRKTPDNYFPNYFKKSRLEALSKLPFYLTEQAFKAVAGIAQNGKEEVWDRVSAILLLTVNSNQNPSAIEVLKDIAINGEDRDIQNSALIQLWSIDPMLASEALEFIDLSKYTGRDLWNQFSLPGTDQSIVLIDVFLSLHQEGLIPSSVKLDLQRVLADYAKKWSIYEKVSEGIDFMLDLDRSQGIRYLSEILLDTENSSHWNSDIIKKLTEIYLGYRNRWDGDRVIIAKALMQAYLRSRGCWYDCSKIIRVLRLYPHPAIRGDIIAEIGEAKDRIKDPPQNLGFFGRRSEVEYCNAYVDEVGRGVRSEDKRQWFYDLCVALKRIDSGQWQQPR